jgi:hypothetical protein
MKISYSECEQADSAARIGRHGFTYPSSKNLQVSEVGRIMIAYHLQAHTNQTTRYVSMRKSQENSAVSSGLDEGWNE